MKNIFIGLVFLGITQSVFTKSLDYSKIEERIKQYQLKVKSLQNTIDKSVFDDEQILINLDFDADNLLVFVQDKFAFQPYVGLLRGVQGTLNSRAGNALDLSVLLAKLLGDAGFETRIANGLLNDKDAFNLVLSINNTQLPTNVGNGAEFEKALVEFSSKKTKKIDWQKTETFKRYTQSKNNLEKLLQANNILLDDLDITSDLVQQTKEYFWVEYRLGQSASWQSVHPALKKGVNVDVKAISYVNKTIQTKYLHQLKVEAFIQQRVGAKLVTHSLMTPWIKPVANLNGVAITYTNLASGTAIGSSIDEIIANTNYFTPIFNGNAVGGKVFDIKGRLIDADVMNAGAQGALFQTLGNKLETSINKIADKKDGETIMQLTAQWLQFTFIQPDGSKFVQKRYLYETDDFKVSKASDKNAKLALISEYNFLTSSGQQPIAYMANAYLNLINDSIPLLQASANKVYNPDAKISISKKDLNIESSFELLVQYSLMDTPADAQTDNDVIKYKAVANLIGIKRGYVDIDNAYIAVDIISNKKNFLIKRDNKIFASIKSAFAAGVWETASEWLPSRFLGLKQQSLDALQIHSAADKQNIAMKILQNGDLKRLNIKDKNILLRIKKEMEQGYAIIIPENKPNNLDMTGWWRINLSTGETLGMTADGGGQSIVEYTTQSLQMALGLVRALGNLKKCEKLTNDVAKLCCLTEAHFNNVAGLAFGNILGASVGTAASAVFDIVDFTIEAATGTGLAPSTNGALCKKAPKIPNL